jgi:hypothetical protein
MGFSTTVVTFGELDPARARAQDGRDARNKEERDREFVPGSGGRPDQYAGIEYASPPVPGRWVTLTRMSHRCRERHLQVRSIEVIVGNAETRTGARCQGDTPGRCHGDGRRGRRLGQLDLIAGLHSSLCASPTLEHQRSSWRVASPGVRTGRAPSPRRDRGVPTLTLILQPGRRRPH